MMIDDDDDDDEVYEFLSQTLTLLLQPGCFVLLSTI